MDRKPIDPLWTEPLELSQRMMDPLGMSRVSEWIVDELLPGITTLTTRARNYSFYCWVIKDIIEKNKGKKSINLSREITKRETAYVFGSILHDCKRDVDPIGVIKARRILSNTEGDDVNTEFSVLEHSYGGFGQYYQSAMERLGLVLRTPHMSVPTPKGEKLGESYKHWIKSTAYYNDYIEKQEIPKKILTDYGNKSCVCLLRENTIERDLLTDVFLEKNNPREDLESSRRDTLHLVLKSIDICSQNNIKFNDEGFRNIVFFQQIKTNSKVINFYPDILKDVIDRWRFFEFQEYLTFSLETLLSCFLNELKTKDTGLTFEEFYEIISDYTTIVEHTLNVDVSEVPVIKILEEMLAISDFDSLSTQNSKKYDESIRLEQAINEYSLYTAANDSLDKKNTKQTIGQVVSLLLMNFLRFYQYKNNIDEIYLWYHSRALQELSHTYLMDERKILDEKTLDDFVKKLYKIILDTHDVIADEKMMSGNITYRCRSLSGRYHFEKTLEPNERSTRINSVIAILEDIGIIDTTSNSTVLSDYGKKILRSIENE